MTCRKFGPVARNYAAARLMSKVGLRVNEARQLDLADKRLPIHGSPYAAVHGVGRVEKRWWSKGSPVPRVC